ncbi:MAG: ATP-grasp domain-containing protein [Armatimonas sp.]
MESENAVAILHQGHAPPVIGGIRKPLKPGGYADSSADIAFALNSAGVPVITPMPDPDPAEDRGWSFPDTTEGIADAISQGARILWANTVLYEGHPIEQALHAGISIVGQEPANVGLFDDKRYTNARLHAAGLPVARACVVGDYEATDLKDWQALTEPFLRQLGLELPVIVKPIRGRGSTGVQKAETWAELRSALETLLSEPEVYGTAALIEEYLVGQEITISVLPPAAEFPVYRSLPPVVRVGHQAGVVPYSGKVSIVQNSRLLLPQEIQGELQELCRYCERAAALVGARMVIRIDCRQDTQGNWKMFDLNMKPNLTGAGRPGRDNEDSLVTMAAYGFDRDYPTLLKELLKLAWTYSR